MAIRICTVGVPLAIWWHSAYPCECSAYPCEYSEYHCEYSAYPCEYSEYRCAIWWRALLQRE